MKSNKIILASAGTGKTYRLALEFVATLLENKDIYFGQILVLTFTKKATSEIREKIFEHLGDIAQNQDLCENLKKITKTKVTKEDKEYLCKIYKNILINKNDLAVYTIDAYVSKIFSSFIASKMGFYNFETVEFISENMIDKLFEKIFLSFEVLDIFKNSKEKSIESYVELIKGLLHLDLMHQIKKKQEKLLKVWLKRPIEDFMGKGIISLSKDFAFCLGSKDFLSKRITEGGFVWARLLKESFWKNLGKKYSSLQQETMDILEEYQNNLRNYIYQNYAIAEHNSILKLAKIVQKEYSFLKKRKSELTFDDISSYVADFFENHKNITTKNGTLKSWFFDFFENEYKFLLIDEFQDTSLVQFKTLLPLIKRIQESKKGNIVVVGDDKQAIYSWRGGQKKLLSNMDIILENTQTYSLETSYRSKKSIIDFVNYIFGANLAENWKYQKISSFSDDNGYIFAKFAKEKKNISGRNLFSWKYAIKDFVDNTIIPTFKNKLINLSKSAILCSDNNELFEFAENLQYHNIPYILESSSSIMEHRAIKPVIWLMEYLVRHDNISLLKFLRSSLVGISGQEVKDLLLDNSGFYKYTKGLSKDLQGEEFFKKVVNKYNLSGIFSTESDLKNIQEFFSIISKSRTINLCQLLKYLLENEKALKQTGLATKNAISLMTVHKSKGLEFESLFYFQNLQKRGEHKKNIEKYVVYKKDFSSVTDSFLTYNYKQIMDVFFNKKKDEDIEKLNKMYVALTRPKNNLFIYSTITPHELENFSNEADVDKKLAQRIYYYLKKSAKTLNEQQMIASKGELKIGKIEKKKTKFRYNYQAFADLPAKNIDNKEQIVSTKAPRGEIIHYYLSFIKWNLSQEHKFALKKTIYEYGLDIKKYQKNILEFVKRNNWIFDKQKWARVYLEYEIFEDDKISRVDRIMISKDHKNAYIIDYKTGSIKDDKQLERYKKELAKISGIKNIQTQYLSILL